MVWGLGATDIRASIIMKIELHVVTAVVHLVIDMGCGEISACT